MPAIRQRSLHALLHDHRVAICVDAAELHRDVGGEESGKRHGEEMRDGVAPDHVVRDIERDGRGVAFRGDPLCVGREAGGDAGRVTRGECAPCVCDDVLAGSGGHVGIEGGVYDGS